MDFLEGRTRYTKDKKHLGKESQIIARGALDENIFNLFSFFHWVTEVTFLSAFFVISVF